MNISVSELCAHERNNFSKHALLKECFDFVSGILSSFCFFFPHRKKSLFILNCGIVIMRLNISE